ncbi:hypothetical protein AcV7_005493 [Taiwanofungus camphoratus]|nr:hypothetical protein AcV7_005493 [Antrodia cinnamomea]
MVSDLCSFYNQLMLHDPVQIFLRNNTAVFAIPPPMLQDHDLMKKLTHFVTDILTELRSSIKTKLHTSIKKRENIGTLARRLASSAMEISLAHWARIAFIRSALIQFEDMPKKSISHHKPSVTASYEAVTTVTTADPDAAICSAAVADGEQIEGTATGEENLTGDTSINTGGLDSPYLWSLFMQPLLSGLTWTIYLTQFARTVALMEQHGRNKKIISKRTGSLLG